MRIHETLEFVADPVTQLMKPFAGGPPSDVEAGAKAPMNVFWFQRLNKLDKAFRLFHPHDKTRHRKTQVECLSD